MNLKSNTGSIQCVIEFRELIPTCSARKILSYIKKEMSGLEVLIMIGLNETTMFHETEYVCMDMKRITFTTFDCDHSPIKTKQMDKLYKILERFEPCTCDLSNRYIKYSGFNKERVVANKFRLNKYRKIKTYVIIALCNFMILFLFVIFYDKNIKKLNMQLYEHFI